MFRVIVAQTSKKWSPSDTLLVMGGAAEKILPYVQQYYYDSGLLNPIHNKEIYKPIFANAIGFYQIGMTIYEGKH